MKLFVEDIGDSDSRQPGRSRRATTFLSRALSFKRDLSELIDEIDMVVWEADPVTFAFTYVSRGAERLLGIPTSDWLADPQFWVKHIHPDDRADAVEMCRTATREGRNHVFEYRMVAADGSIRHVRDLVRVTTDEDGAALRLRGVIVDTGARPEVAQKARFQALERELLQARRLETVGRLAGSVAHDFNNVLTIVLSYADFLVETLHAGDPRREDVEQIRKTVACGADLAGQLLTFSRKQQRLEPKILDVNQVVDGVQKLLRRLIKPTIQVEVCLTAEPVHVLIDAGQLEQIIMNLVINARDAMPEGGKLTLSTETKLVSHLQSRPDLPSGRYVAVVVRDTGVGMNDATRSRIFEPFFTTKKPEEGSGLGLATVRDIASNYGGRILVESAPGAGTTFEVLFPPRAM